MRKIVQIAAAFNPKVEKPLGVTVKSEDRLFALCDDGTVWMYIWDGPETWCRLAPVPQPEWER